MKAFYINTCGEIHSSESCFFYKKWLMKLSSLFVLLSCCQLFLTHRWHPIITWMCMIIQASESMRIKTAISAEVLISTAFWGIVSVIIDGRQHYNDVSLQFNIETNALYFKKDSTAYKISGKVQSFHITYPDSTHHQTVYFKSGYPNDSDSLPVFYTRRLLKDEKKVF